MPELPEVEVSRMGIEPHIKGKEIKKVIVRHPQLRWPIPEGVHRMEGQRVTAVTRRAKYLMIETAEGTGILHLGMSGKLRVIEGDTPLIKHDHVDITFEDGQVLRFNDPRRFGAFLWQGIEEPTLSLLTNLGPEPLLDDFNVDYLVSRLAKKKTNIKQTIMDNKIVVGVGNIYANEALFKAGIRPDRAADTLSEDDIGRLVPIIKETLANAIKQGGTTLKDFAQTDGKPGYFAQELLVYGRGDQPCFTCGTELTEKRIGQRSTVFCHICQH